MKVRKNQGSGDSAKSGDSEHARSTSGMAVSNWFPLLTVFVTGASVMIVEIVGSRVLSPVFGVGLFVWSSLLSVTMAALAIGYFTGGRMADRFPGERLLFGAVALAGALTGLLPMIRASVLVACDPLGIRFGSLIGAAILFGPPLMVLGAAGPIAVRLLNRDLAFTGRAAGTVYGVSTVGSLVGSLLTGFVLVPGYEIGQILVATALALIAVAVVGSIGIWRIAAAAALMIPLVAAGFPDQRSIPGIQIRERVESWYGRLEVIDDAADGIRYLRADQSVIGSQDRVTGHHIFPYIDVAFESLMALRPDSQKVLQIGLGIGSLPTLFSEHGIRCDAVELDSEVVRLAEVHFGYRSDGTTHVGDGRTWLNELTGPYDLVVHDTFTGGATPHHLLTREVLTTIRSLLTADGVLALNFYGFADGQHAAASQLVARTLRDVFPHVRTFRDRPLDENPERPANLVYLASREPLDLSGIEGKPFSSADFPWWTWEVLREVPEGPVVTDLWNPLERMQLAVGEQYYLAMRRMFPRRMWSQ